MPFEQPLLGSAGRRFPAPTPCGRHLARRAVRNSRSAAPGGLVAQRSYRGWGCLWVRLGVSIHNRKRF